VQYGCEATPIVFIAARELPKGASVEWQVMRHTGDPPWPTVSRPCSTRAESEDSSGDEDENEVTVQDNAGGR
jgi:hypothetical protein